MPASSQASDFDSDSPRISDVSVATSDYHSESPRLRGLRWRVLLGVLPACPAPIEALRRAAANGRRRYAELRRRLIVDPHVMDDGFRGDNLSVDNPLSQEPESIWRRYFKNTEIEKTIESDLTRLYPEHGTFFQSCSCQAMLRRILLVWALIHPEYGYRQGMHEVLAPLVYVLHMDVTHLAQVRQRYEDPFEDRFDTPFEENYSHGRQMMASFSAHSALLSGKEATFKGDEDWIERVHPDDVLLLEPDDFGFNLKTMVLGSDSYGAEGELGALLSGRFVEHDAYCMLDALMRGQGGAVKLADYFMAATEAGLATGISPVLEASGAMYRSLAVVDMPLYIHLVGLGVEPQFFALRWLRVLFGREFDLDKLLLLWDAVFAASNNSTRKKESMESSDDCRSSPRGSFISSFAVSMLLHLRPALLAAPNATSCLQKLLNFPKNVDIRNLVENAKVLQSLSEEQMATFPPPSPARFFDSSRGRKHKNGSHSPPFQTHIPPASKVLLQRHTVSAPDMSRPSPPESYWEELWINSVLPKAVSEEVQGLQTSDATAVGSASISATLKSDMLSDVLRDNVPMGASEVCHGASLNKQTRRKLLPGLSGGATGDDRKENASVSSSESLPGSPQRYIECRSSDPVKELVLDSSSLAGSTPVEASLEVIENGSRPPDCEENILLRDQEDGRDSEHCLSAQYQEHVDDQPIPLSTAGAGALWSFVESSRSLPSQEKTSRGLKLTDSKGALQTLGQSMMESIQILENAFTQKSSSGKEGALTVSKERPESLHKAFLNGKGHVSALSAIAELRKISNILLEM